MSEKFKKLEPIPIKQEKNIRTKVLEVESRKAENYKKTDEILEKREDANREISTEEIERNVIAQLREKLKKSYYAQNVIEVIKNNPTLFPYLANDLIEAPVNYASSTRPNIFAMDTIFAMDKEKQYIYIDTISKFLSSHYYASNIRRNSMSSEEDSHKKMQSYLKNWDPNKKTELISKTILYLNKNDNDNRLESIYDLCDEFYCQENDIIQNPIIIKQIFKNAIEPDSYRLTERAQKLQSKIIKTEESSKIFQEVLIEKIDAELSPSEKYQFEYSMDNILKLIQKYNIEKIPVKTKEKIKSLISFELSKRNFDKVAKLGDSLNLEMTHFLNNEIQNKNWANVYLLQSNSKQLHSFYIEFLKNQKEITYNRQKPFSERKKSFSVLIGLAENGDDSIIDDFAKIIKQMSGQKIASDSKWGLDSIQESAFYTLMGLDNSVSNDALFNLLDNKNVNTSVKYAVLKKLSSNQRNFLDNENKWALKKWLYSKSIQELDWQDLKFIKAILNNIPSSELRKKSQKHIGWSFEELSKSEQGANQVWQKKYNNIPENIFLQLHNFAKGDKILLDKFQKLYTIIKKENAKKENLLYGIINSLETESQILELLINKLKEIDFSSKQDADSLSELLRRIVFLNRIENIKNYQYDEDSYDQDEDYEEQPQEKQPPPEITEIFSKEAKNLNELVSLVKEVATRKFQEILPNENITDEKIEAIEKEWGDLEPIFTYLGRFPSLKKYVAEIVANIDTAEGWKNWRYDLNKNGVKNQIGHLSKEQLEIWEGDYFSEIGDIMITETSSDKPIQIQQTLREAILQHRHIFNPEMGQTKNEFISKTLETIFSELAKTPDKQSEIIDNEIKNIFSDARSVDTIINFNNLPRVKQGVELILSTGAEIIPSSKIKNTVDFISAYLPPELRKTLESNYARLEDQKKMAAGEFFIPEMRQAVEQRAREIEESYQNAFNSDIWEKYQLDKSNAKNLEQFYQKRQELKSAIDLLRLLDLSNKLIATNRIAEKEGKKGGETITSVLERLKKYFKDSPLAQDISNVEFVLKEKIDFGEKRRLAMIFTDNSQMLWQAGKYPLGNGSCQHYADGTYASRLMGYVGDPNCKVAYLIDLNKLPQNIKNEVEEKGFEETKNKISKQDLLNASLARSIIKMARNQENKPVILLEPTYTVVYKGDVSMDRYFNLFVDLMVVEPMKAKMARGGGSESVIKGKSLSPGGQYEDLDLNSVKFIHKLSKPTKEEIEVMGKIRSSR